MNKQAVYEEMKKRIADEDLLPGQWIVERDLCETYGISRTPVREILLRLSNEGLLEAESGKGYKVKKLSSEEIIAVFKARAAVEGYGARLVCANLTPTLQDSFNAIKKEMDAVDVKEDLESVLGLGRKLHDTIMQGTENFLLQEFYEKLRNYTVLTNNYTKKRVSKELEENSKQGHLKLIETLTSGTPEQAEKEMRNHLQEGIRLVLETYVSKFADLF